MVTIQRARLIVIDAHGRVLLLDNEDAHPVHIEYPGMRRYWLTPGGGVEPGETLTQAAIREMREETGIEIDAPGRVLWTFVRNLQFPDGARCRFEETFFEVRVDAPLVRLEAEDPANGYALKQFRWWTPPELLSSREAFLPHWLPQRIADFLLLQEADS